MIGAGLIIFSDLKDRSRKLRMLPTQAELDSVLPGSRIKDRKDQPIPHYPGMVMKDGKPVPAAALLTAELPPVFKGFTDQINLLFSIDRDGKILQIRVISQRETPHYFRMIRASGFFEKMIGKNLRELPEIKAVSGASISSQAILDDLQTSARMAMKEIFHQPVAEAGAVSAAQIYFQPKIIGLAAILLMGLMARYYRKGWLRGLVFGASIVGIGAWLKTPFSLPHLFQILSGQIPFRSNPYLVTLGAFVILTTIIFGPLWCAHLCPYAGLQELLSRLGKNFRWHPSPNAARLGRQLRWLVLFASVVLCFGLKIRSGSEIEPFFHLFSGKWTMPGMTLVVLTLSASFFLPRFWCRYFCPTGACLLLLSSHRKLFRRIEEGIRVSGIDTGGSGEESSRDKT